MKRPSLAPLVAATLAATGLAGCVSAAPQPTDRTEARLLNADASNVRSAIRGFVRDYDGGDYVADPDSLSGSAELELRERERPDDDDAAVRFEPKPDYRLVMDGQSRCWLVRIGADGSEDAVWLQDARCESAA
ncbi:MAG: hypothetical protein WBG08_03080 [Litorimonas sp.]